MAGDRWESAASWDEAVHILGANLRQPLAKLTRPSLMVTSARPGEGKTTTCVALGMELARRGLRVILVDLDLRAPDAHLKLGVANDLGVADVVTRQASPTQCLRRVTVAGSDPTSAHTLYFLPGRPVDNPHDLLGRPRTAKLLERLADDADILLVDAPAVLPVADALTIGQAVEGALIVLDPRRTSAAPLERARTLLRRNNTDVVGLVVNDVRSSDAAALDRYGIAP